MSDRSPHTFRCDDETWSQFVEWVEDVEGQKHGEIGRHVQNALEEYMNEDRQARLEKNQQEMQEQLADLTSLLSEGEGTHTHTGKSECGGSTRVEKIHRKIVNNEKGAVKDAYLEQVIEEVAGLLVGDDRTLRNYKEKLRQRGLLFEHPGDPPIWTADRQLWTKWVNSTSTSRDHAEEICEPYPASVHQNGHGHQIEIHEVNG